MMEEYELDLLKATIDTWKYVLDVFTMTTNPCHVKAAMEHVIRRLTKNLWDARDIADYIYGLPVIPVNRITDVKKRVKALQRNGDNVTYFAHAYRLFNNITPEQRYMAFAVCGYSLLSLWSRRFRQDNVHHWRPCSTIAEINIRHVELEINRGLAVTKAALVEGTVTEYVYEQLRRDILPYLKHS